MNRFFYAFLIAFTITAIPAIAQDNSAREVEEVVVTALRKETNLQDTAITITAISAEDIEKSIVGFLFGAYKIAFCIRKYPSFQESPGW